MKLLKKLSLILTAVLLVCSFAALTACGESGEKADYSVTVLSPAGEPLKGIKVKWGTDKNVIPTISTGKATNTLAAGDYEISLDGLPDFYKYTPVTATAAERDKTITLEWNPEDGKVVYTVKVVLPDSNPVKGVSVGLCVPGDGGTCTFFPEKTNDKGEAYSMGVLNENIPLYLRGLVPADYEVQIIDSTLPSGYEVEVNGDNHYAGGKVTAKTHSITVTLTAKTV